MRMLHSAQLNWGSPLGPNVFRGDLAEEAFVHLQRQNGHASHLSLHESHPSPFWPQLNHGSSWNLAEVYPLNKILPQNLASDVPFCVHFIHTENWKLPSVSPFPASGPLWFFIESILQDYYMQYAVPEHFVIWKWRPLQRGLAGVTNMMRVLNRPFMTICRIGHGKLDCPRASASLCQEPREVSTYKALEYSVEVEGFGAILSESTQDIPQAAMPPGRVIQDLMLHFRYPLQFQE